MHTGEEIKRRSNRFNHNVMVVVALEDLTLTTDNRSQHLCRVAMLVMSSIDKTTLKQPFYSISKPVISMLITKPKYLFSSSKVSYSGKSILLKQVCALGYIHCAFEMLATQKNLRVPS